MAARAFTAAAAVLGVLLGVALAALGGFLVPLRIDGIVAPVCVVIALVGNSAAGWLVGTATGSRLVAALPGAVWLALSLLLGTARPEGDIIIEGNAVGYAYLLAGAIAAVAGVFAVRAHQPAGDYDGPDGRPVGTVGRRGERAG